MIAELDEITKLFRNVDGRLHALLLKYAAVRGVTEKDIEKLAERERSMWESMDGYRPDEKK